VSGLADEDDVTTPEEESAEEAETSDEAVVDDVTPPEDESAEEAQATPEADEAEIDEPADEPSAEEAPADEAPPPSGPSLDDVVSQIQAIPVGSFLLSTVSTLASLAYGKLEKKELEEARGAIDAMGALMPVLEGRIEPGLKRDFEQALTNLRLAYADVSAKAEP
jgi:hypothetical protein